MNARLLDPAAARPRLGFLGLGWIGARRLADLDADAADCVAFADADAGLARRAAAGRPGAICGTGLRELLAAHLDGVVIATPSGLHEEQARAALTAGLAVFCQKPLATNAAGAARVIAAAEKANRLLAADFCYRHVAGVAALRDALQAGQFGHVVALDLTFHNAYAPAAAWSHDTRLAGGGCLLDLGIHLVDLALWLLDFPALEVESARLFGHGVPWRDGDIEDFAAVTLRAPGGTVVRLACSWNLHAGQGAQIELAAHGTRGGGAWRNVGGSFQDFETWRFENDRRTLLARDAGEWNGRALDAWARALARDRRFSAAAHELAASAAVIDAIYLHAGGTA
jgi:predicted dehydrogenase